MSKKTLKHYAAEKLDTYIELRKAESALYYANKTDYYDNTVRIAEEVGDLACDAALDAFKLAARSRDAHTIHTVVRTLRNYGNDWLFDELAEDLFEEEKAA